MVVLSFSKVSPFHFRDSHHVTGHPKWLDMGQKRAQPDDAAHAPSAGGII
jgi:hypothetical protein